MKNFDCPACSATVFFRSLDCEACGVALFYEPSSDRFVAEGAACPNRDTATRCNWVAADGGHCRSCTLDVHHDNHELEVPFQDAKRRTIRQLLAGGVGIIGVAPPLRFDLRPSTDDDPVMTGHAEGLITINTAEADPVHLVETRENLGEPYRTPLGHVRHELGHWYWASAAGPVFDLEECRDLFGDERADYGESLEAHYATPDTGQWTDSFVSHYAAAHPWEDFAESFAHVLHMDDTLETATTHGLVPSVGHEDFDTRYEAWVDLAVALNDLNRSMGTADPYPFVVPPPAVAKLRFVDQALRDTHRPNRST